MKVGIQDRPIVVLGSGGQVGKALMDLFKDLAVPLTRSVADLSFPNQVLSLLDQIQPKIVINAAAYTAVDLAEQNENQAMTINGIAPGVLADWCQTHHSLFVHYSTDYVFSGKGESPWKEEDPTSPLSAYGRSKLEGEKRIVAAGGRYLIFRTSWVYDSERKNFVTTMLKLGKEKDLLQVVADQFGSPTYAPHLAWATVQAIEAALKMKIFPTGIYNLCNSGTTTWHEFALALFSISREKGTQFRVKEIRAISSSEFLTPAKRPLNSRLALNKSRQILGVSMPVWEQGLKECMENLHEGKI